MNDDEWLDNLIRLDQRRRDGVGSAEDSFHSSDGGEWQEALLKLDATKWMTIDPAEVVIRNVYATRGESQSGDETASFPSISNYEIVRQLGSGGMGNVYAAVRTSGYRQLVAIKVLRGDLACPDWRDRFERERQVLAELNHPNICRLLDGGNTSDGRPFLVMEFIDGLPIDRFCETHRLPSADRVRLFEQLCIALSHAHQQGIVHRDVKPSNVLVDRRGTIRVTDFGLARRLHQHGDELSLTQSQQILGTPSFMSPEQASGNIAVGVASDIYSLGAILYCLLAGRPPYRGDHPIETLTQVIHEDPLPLRRLVPKISIDLETITMKCLEKNPSRRYGDVQELLTDVHLFLSRQPIRSRPVSSWERARRWICRNPVVAALLATLIATTLVGVSSVAIQWREAVAARNASSHNASVAYQMAKSALKLSEHLLEQKDCSGEELPFILQTVESYEELAAQPEATSTIRFELAQTHHFVGRYFASRGRFKEAVRSFLRQVDFLTKLLEQDPKNERFRYDLFYAYHSLAEACRFDEDPHRQDDYDQRAAAILTALVHEFPDNPFYADAQAAQSFIDASKALRSWDLDTADHSARRTLSIASHLAAKQPLRKSPPFFEFQQIQALQLLANNARLRGNGSTALQLAREAFRICDALHRQVPVHPEFEFNIGYHAIVSGTLLLECGEFEDASKCLYLGVELIQKSNASLPDSPQRNEHLLDGTLRLAWLEWNINNFEQSRKWFEKVDSQQPKLDQLDTMSSGALRTRLFWEANCPFEDLRDRSLISKMVEILESRDSSEPDFSFWSTLALAKFRLDRFSDSEQAIQRSLSLCPIFMENDWLLLALIQCKRGDREAAESSLEKIHSDEFPIKSKTCMQSLGQEFEFAWDQLSKH